MISRRNLITATGAGALSISRTTRAQESEPTKRHIAQAAHLTVEIPAHWSHTPPPPGGSLSVGAPDGFFVAIPVRSLSSTKELSQAFNLSEKEIEETAITWRGTAGVRLEFRSDSDGSAISATGIPNPHPILTMQGLAEHLMLAGDSDHFDEIMETISFGLEYEVPGDLAKSIVAIIHANSYFRDAVDWDGIYDQADKIESEAEIDSFLKFRVLSELRTVGDNHSFVVNLKGIVDVATPTVDGQPPNYPTGEIIEGYGYISFPGTNLTTPEYPADYARIAAELRNQFVEEGVCGWIIDLRNMRGGSVSPALTALYPFLPDGNIAGFVDAYGNEMWIEKNGTQITPAAYLQDIGDVPWLEELSDSAIPVAVLTGPNNGSAGEFVQLALMSRENLLTFGLPTGGYTTGNIGLPLYNSHHLALASTAELDVHGNVYTGKIEPDVEDFNIGRGVSILPANLETALDWLEQQCASAI